MIEKHWISFKLTMLKVDGEQNKAGRLASTKTGENPMPKGQPGCFVGLFMIMKSLFVHAHGQAMSLDEKSPVFARPESSGKNPSTARRQGAQIFCRHQVANALA